MPDHVPGAGKTLSRGFERRDQRFPAWFRGVVLRTLDGRTCVLKQLFDGGANKLRLESVKLGQTREIKQGVRVKVNHVGGHVRFRNGFVVRWL